MGSNPTTSALEEIQESCVHGVVVAQELPNLLVWVRFLVGVRKIPEALLVTKDLAWKRAREA